ncbi:MAG: SDR family NAD(P)-dependent oxidoreductase [Sphingobacteriales bacterium]|nr:MAG: SDR family NAD(P)-dependent oxidoreductase [Sphingobacteriales bacterium]
MSHTHMPQHIIITGANTGIGLATAKSLAAQGHHLILACRDFNKAATAAEQVKQSGAASVHVVKLDLADLDSIKQTVADINAIFPAVDVLINNAGLFNHHYQQTVQGYESHFGVNVLGTILLTELLLPSLKAAPQARIVNLASVAHLAGKIDPASYKKPAKYRPIAAYGQSKLGNLLYSNALATRLQGSSVTSNALHRYPRRLGNLFVATPFGRRAKANSNF